MQKLIPASMILIASLAGCDFQASPSAQTSKPVNAKQKELASYPVGLKVTHAPNPVKAERGGRSCCKYTWLYTTTVRSTAGSVTIDEYGAFVWMNDKWVLSTSTGKPFTAKDFIKCYSCPDAKIEPGQSFSDPLNWSGTNVLRARKAKWYFVGIDEKGRRVKGEAVIEELPALGD